MSSQNPYDVDLDGATFTAIICDCYRRVHPPLTKKKIMDDDGEYKWKQVPYHYGSDWEIWNRC